MPRNATNEWEFQGEVLSWVNLHLAGRDLGFERATQEFPDPKGKRSDVVIWRDHASREAALEIELKTPMTPLSEISYQRDAVSKAQSLGADYVALWNMRRLELHKTPSPPRKDLLPSDLMKSFTTLASITHTDDWLRPENKADLNRQAYELLLAVHDLDSTGAIGGAVIDATVFVEYLTEQLRKIRSQLRQDFNVALGSDRPLRTDIYNWAAKQGLTGFVNDLHESLAAQLAYRVAGQCLFYFSFKRHVSLPEIVLSPKAPLQSQLRSYWDAVRAYDYEALFEESPLESVPLRKATEESFIRLVNQLATYDWDNIDLDVLGSVFEQLIPESERMLLGQYYTNPRLVDLIVSLTIESSEDVVLDPAVGTGTFLFRAHELATRTESVTHSELLARLWGVDISGFAAELAVINLCRVDLASRTNFPRVAVRDFFDLKPGSTIGFPPAKRMPGAFELIDVRVPEFDAIVGNPPYVRSQQLDDLDDTYKQKLQNLAYIAGAGTAPKFDAFAYFMVHAHRLLRDGGRLGFVTSAAWLTAGYGAALQRFLLEKFQPELIIWSEVEPFFAAVEVDTVVIVLRKLATSEAKLPRGPIRFVRLTRFLSEVLPSPSDQGYWVRLRQLAGSMEAATTDGQSFSVTLMDGQKELDALRENPKGLRLWAQYLRMSDVYRELFL